MKKKHTTNSNQKLSLLEECQNCKFNNETKKLRNNYIATLSHDLKTPTLAQIRTLELFLRGTFGDLSEEQKDIIELMLDSSMYMYSMIDTLVTSYKYENGEITLSYEEFNILEILEECIRELDSRIKKSNLKISIKSNLEFPYINADKKQIKQVLINLLSNCINYGFEHSKIKIILNDIIDNNIPKLIVKFISNSPHITQDTISNIFKRYVSHADKFNTVGAGLGLYLLKQIIEAHNGNIFVTSSEDNINTFGFIINIKN